MISAYSFLLLKLLAFADSTTCDDSAFLQAARSKRTWTLARDWKTSRDLANVTDIEPFPIPGSSARLEFTSAVPVFGPDASYIALMHRFDSENPVEYLYNSGALSLFCSGPEKSHQTKVRVIGNETYVGYQRVLVFICDWPEEEKHLERFEVSLDDGDGNHVGTVGAEQKSGLLQQYRTAACVRDVYPNAIYGLRMLPQWLEFHLQHGVEHFIIYTVNLDSETLVSLWEPYIKSGVVTRVHFDKDFEGNSGRGHGAFQLVDPMMQDCLFRYKNHATWVLPHMDIDEFFHTKDGSVFEGGEVPDDYLGTTWDAVVASQGYQTNEAWADHVCEDMVHSISFPLYRFDIADPGQIETWQNNQEWFPPCQESGDRYGRAHNSMVACAPTPQELSSVLREEEVQPTCPKYVVNTNVVNAIFTHWVTSWKAGSQGLSLGMDAGVAHHYRERHDWAIQGNITANTVDTSMLQQLVFA
eukprot:Skav235673  [mRNA]  locus=scaffold358:1201835:1205829:- [translate_table: standard]